jgi:CDP-ribitol ribitolphosphotransferase
VDLKYKIAKKNKEKIFDFSDKSEINDLLFITDVLITDYSSVIYEASLLNIPMLFYAFDLDDYINSRDFYFEYEINVPGKVVYTENDLIQAILNNDYEHEKVEEFCRKNFDIRDGKASERVALFVENLALNKDTGMPAQ